MLLTEIFDIKVLTEPKLSPVESLTILKQSLLAKFTEDGVKQLISKHFAGKILHSYKLNIGSEAYLIYAVFKQNMVEYHFFNLAHADQSADTLNKLSNSTEVFTNVISVIYTDVVKGYTQGKVINIISGDRTKLYLKMVNKIFAKVPGYYAFDVTDEGFKIAKKMDESKSYRDFILAII